jgi:signal transduction histidine kinase
MAKQESKRVAFETARLRLARLQMASDTARDAGFRLVTQVVGEALKVERVGVWMFEDGQRELVCRTQFVLSQGRHDSGQRLHARDFPRYVTALQERRAVVADDAIAHPLTGELADAYLRPAGITSILDAPIVREGRVTGVICHEQVGPARAWSQREIDFAGSAADIVALILEQADRADLQTALKMQSDQRAEGRKLEALGKLARSVAHDFNNLIMVNLGVADLAERERSCDCCRQSAQALRQSAQVGQRLIQQLLKMSARPGSNGHRSDAAGVLQRLEGSLRMLVGSQVELSVMLEEAPAWVRVAESELEQIVLNLAANARDAIAGPGHLHIAVRRPEPDDEIPPDCLMLEVVDDGRGMDERTRAHLFEPYFTTKERGNGLGLATVYGIVKTAGGSIQVASEPGRGTGFRIALPRAQPSGEK